MLREAVERKPETVLPVAYTGKRPRRPTQQIDVLRPLRRATLKCMWTTLLASYAAIVSSCSVVISYLSYKSGGPQLSGSAGLIGRYDLEGPILFVSLHNRGRGPVTVDSVLLWGLGSTEVARGALPVVGWPLHPVNSQLPVRIEGHSGVRWNSPAQKITKEWLKRDDLVKLAVSVHLAHGKFLDLVVDTSDVDDLDRDNLPAWEAESGKPGKSFKPGL